MLQLRVWKLVSRIVKKPKQLTKAASTLASLIFFKSLNTEKC